MSPPKSILKRKSKYSTAGNQTSRRSTVGASRKQPTPTVAETSIRASSNASGSATDTDSVSESAGDETQTVNSQRPSSSYKSSRQQSAFEKPSTSAKSYDDETEKSNTTAKTTVIVAGTGTHTRKTTENYKNSTSKTKTTDTAATTTVEKKSNDEEKPRVVAKILTAAAAPHGKTHKQKSEPPQSYSSRNNPETEFYQATKNTAPKVDNQKYQYQQQQQHTDETHQRQWPQQQEKMVAGQGQKPTNNKKPASSRPMLLAKSTKRSSWTQHPSWAIKGHNVAPFGVPLPTRAKKAPPHVSQVGPLQDPRSTAVFAGGTAHSRVFPDSTQGGVEEAKCTPKNELPPKQESAPIEFYLEPQQITTKSTFMESLPQKLSEPTSVKSTKSPPPVQNAVKSSQTPNDKSTMIEPPPPPPVQELPKCQPVIQPVISPPRPAVQVECKIVQPELKPPKQKQHHHQQQQPKLQHHSKATSAASEASEASSSSSSKIQRIYIKDDHTQTKHHHFKNAENQQAVAQVSASISEKPPFQPPLTNQNPNPNQQNVLSKTISSQDEATVTEEVREQKHGAGAKAKCIPKNKPVYNSPYAKKKLMESFVKDRALLEQKQEDVCQKCKLLQKNNDKAPTFTLAEGRAGNPGAPASCPVDTCGVGGGGNKDEKTKICIIIDKGFVEKETIEKDAKN